jgi:hypothetical protein
MFENVVPHDTMESVDGRWQAFRTAGHECCGDVMQRGKFTRLRTLAIFWF